MKIKIPGNPGEPSRVISLKWWHAALLIAILGVAIWGSTRPVDSPPCVDCSTIAP